MTNKKSLKLWAVNVISFVLFLVISITGLINWLILPKGYETRGTFLASFRHFLVEIHQWAALLFMVVLAIHVLLHWSYIKTNLRKYGILKEDQ